MCLSRGSVWFDKLFTGFLVANVLDAMGIMYIGCNVMASFAAHLDVWKEAYSLSTYPTREDMVDDKFECRVHLVPKDLV